ncbi:MAG: tetratricopeptide repeat protein, partial [Candidatus Omnitrophica bacterium]|nr:tetratricopeptide repeat protein [Candidatus Omnitrophota bacterium]
MRKILKIVLYITAALLFAVFIYTKNKEGNERAATSLYFEGKKLEAEGKYPEALAKLKKAVGLKPDLGKGYLMIGVVYSREEDFPQAAEEFKKALTAKLDKRNKAITHHNLGAIYLEQFNKPDEAIEQFNLAIKTDPNFIDPASDPHFGL